MGSPAAARALPLRRLHSRTSQPRDRHDDVPAYGWKEGRAGTRRWRRRGKPPVLRRLSRRAGDRRGDGDELVAATAWTSSASAFRPSTRSGTTSARIHTRSRTSCCGSTARSAICSRRWIAKSAAATTRSRSPRIMRLVVVERLTEQGFDAGRVPVTQLAEEIDKALQPILGPGNYVAKVYTPTSTSARHLRSPQADA